VIEPDPSGESVWDFDWSDPEKVAALRAKIEAECEAEDPQWAAAHRHQFDDHWNAALALFGVTPHPHET
jgi:hypothetical protein